MTFVSSDLAKPSPSSPGTGMRPTQRPTATNIRVRSTRDANILFHAVNLGILPIVARRLDAADRAALRPGCVYIWEERSPGSLGSASDGSGMGMERFTEGRHWFPSRVRDDFLLYVEKDTELNDHRLRGNNPPIDAPSGSQARRQPLVKQTYSAWVNTGNDLKKWHLNAYYTEDALEHLRTVDDISVLAELRVPHECYQRARASGSSTSATAKKAIAPLSSLDSEVGRDRSNISPMHSSRFAPFTPSPIASNNTSRTSGEKDPPSGGRISPLDYRLASNPYRTPYSYPPPSAAPQDEAMPGPHAHTPHHNYSHTCSRNARPIHTLPPGVYLPPLSVPSQGLTAHNHTLSSSPPSTSSVCSSSFQLPSISHSASTSTPTPATASPYSHRYSTPHSKIYSPSPSPSGSTPPSMARTPPLNANNDSSKRRDRDDRTLVPLAALCLSDTRPESGASSGRKRYRIDEEALRAFKPI